MFKMPKKKLTSVQKKSLFEKLAKSAQEGDIDSLTECIKTAGLPHDDDTSEHFRNALNTIIIMGYADAATILMEKITVEFPHILLALEKKRFAIAKELLIKSGELTLNEKDFENILKNLDPINPECLEIKKIIRKENNSLKEKISEYSTGKRIEFSENELDLIRSDPAYFLHSNYVPIRDIYNTPLLAAIINDNTDIAIKLIELDKEKKSLDQADNTYNAGNPPLVLAMKRANKAIATALIQAGANPNCQGFRGFTPLHWACILRLNDVIELLLEKGADPQIENAFGKKAGDYYRVDITMEDLCFHPSVVSVEERKQVRSYNRHTIFESIAAKNDSTIFREVTGHNFATKTPDYSDLYWHIAGIFQNLNLPHPTSQALGAGNMGRNNFELYLPEFIKIRSGNFIRDDLAEKMKINSSKLNVSI